MTVPHHARRDREVEPTRDRTQVPTVDLKPHPITTTRLGFGCAGLMRAPSRRERDAVLSRAIDVGVRHFDTARMYGLGMAEGELGRALTDRRDAVVIATKFGLEPPGRWLGRVQAPARSALALSPTLRRIIKRGADSSVGRGRYDAASARQSLQASLRALGTDYVDILFLHGPSPSQVAQEDVCDYLEEARALGYIRAWGVSGEYAPSAEVASRFAVPTVLQFRRDVFSSRPVRAHQPFLIYGALSNAMTRIQNYLAEDPRRRHRWNEATGCDCANPEHLAALLLREALDFNRDGVVVFATGRPDRVEKAAGDLEAAAKTPPEVDALRSLILTELAPRGAAGP